MAKRGRPTVKERYKDINDFNNGVIQNLITNGTGRSMTNAYYSELALRIFSEDAAQKQGIYIKHWNDIMFKNCITEQIGRMILQYRDGIDDLRDVVFVTEIAAEEYHNGTKAKDIAAGMRKIRKYGLKKFLEESET